MDTTTMLVIGGVVLVLLVAGIGFLVMRGRARRAAAAETFHHFRCSGCGRRLRYRARQVGHKGQCSHCGRELVFPPVSRSSS